MSASDTACYLIVFGGFIVNMKQLPTALKEFAYMYGTLHISDSYVLKDNLAARETMLPLGDCIL